MGDVGPPRQVPVISQIYEKFGSPATTAAMPICHALGTSPQRWMRS